MPNFTTPGVYTFETDNSNYPTAIDGSVVGIVGFAKKGPTNVATLITSPENLITIFGEPDEAIYGQGVEAALELLEVTNQIYFIRAVGETAAVDASAMVKLGGCPAIEVSAGTYGVSSHLYLKAQVYDNAGVAQFASPRTFAIPSGTVGTTGNQAEALRTIIGGALDSDALGVHYLAAGNTTGYMVGSYAGSGAHVDVSAYSDSAYTTGLACLQTVNINGSSIAAASSVVAYGTEIVSTSASNSAGYLVESIYPGTGYNLGTKSDGSTSGNSVEVVGLGGQNVLLQVNENGFVKESFKVSLVASGVFVEDVINTGEVDLVSYVIKGNLVDDLADITANSLAHFSTDLSALGISTTWGAWGPSAVALADSMKFPKFIVGTYGLTTGTDGIPTAQADKAAALIGVANAEPKTGLQALDDPLVDISLAIVPGVTDQNVQNALITLAEATQDFMVATAPPYAVGTAQDAIDWSNGQKTSRTAAISSSYAAVYWPWVKVFSPYDGIDRYLDPAIYGLRQMVYTDSVSESWFAPAGFRRGRLTKPTDTEVKLNLGDRQALYSGGNIVNPIVNFVGNGITIFGQRTAQRTASATDRINVRRLMIGIRKMVKRSTIIYAFEPNDPILWQQIEGILNPALQDIKVRRGITSFRVVCDETTNTPVRQDRNELWCRVEIKPTKSAEVLVFELNLVSQSTDIG
jgi:phage tail sheath protein FI